MNSNVGSFGIHTLKLKKYEGLKEGSLNPNPTLDNLNNAHRTKVLSKSMDNVFTWLKRL